MARFRPAATAVVIADLLTLALAPSASAEIRNLFALDPADATPTLSGQPNNPDIKAVAMQYDSVAGRFSLAVEFYNSVNALDTSQNYGFVSTFGVGSGSPSTTPGFESCSAYTNGGINGQHHVFSNVVTFFNRASVAGFDGYMEFTRAISADGKRIEITGVNGALVGRDYRCANYELRVRTRGPASSPNTRYDESCDCWYFEGPLDRAGTGETIGIPVLWFEGFKPVYPVCSDGLDNDGDGHTDSDDDLGCSSATDTSESAHLASSRLRKIRKRIANRTAIRPRGCERESDVRFVCDWRSRTRLYKGPTMVVTGTGEIWLSENNSLFGLGLVVRYKVRERFHLLKCRKWKKQGYRCSGVYARKGRL